MRGEILSAPVGNVLYKLTLPMVFGIMAVLFFQLVDTYFISLLGTGSLAALSFTMPVSLGVMNLSIGLGIACSALVARAVGGDDHRSAQHYIMSTLCLSVLLAAGLMIAGYVWNDELFLLLGATPEQLPAIREYMNYWWPGGAIMVLMMVINSAMRAVGNTKLPSMMMLWSAVLNAVLDPLLIFGIGPFPEMGLAGAALATTICWGIVMVVMLHALAGIDLLKWAGLGLSHMLQVWRKLLALGIPASVTNVMVPLASSMLIAMIAPLGEDKVAAFGVGMRIEPFSVVIIYALTSTLPTFVGQNFAAGTHDRIWQALRVSVKYIMVIQLVIWGLLYAAGPLLAAVFTDDEAVAAGIMTFLLWMPAGYAGMGIVLCANACLNALHHTTISMVLNTVRLIGLYVPLAWIGAELGGYEGIMIGATLGNLLAGAIVLSQINRAQNKEWFGVRNGLREENAY